MTTDSASADRARPDQPARRDQPGGRDLFGAPGRSGPADPRPAPDRGGPVPPPHGSGTGSAPEQRTERLAVPDHSDRDHAGRDHADRDHSDRTVPEERTISAKAARRETLHEQKARFGGIKWGAAFFGWLTAVGTAVLLTGVVALVTSAGVSAPDAAGDVARGIGAPTPDGSIVGAVVAAVVVFLGYLAGGYVAGRMARFSGAKQGIAVWVWAVVVAVVVGLLVAFSGRGVDLAAAGVALGIPADPTSLTVGGIVAAAVALVVGLAGAVLGGLAGMRYHRKIDKATPAV
jgi:hypothetical protein